MGNTSSLSSVIPTSPSKNPCVSSSPEDEKKGSGTSSSKRGNNSSSNNSASVAQQAAEKATERAKKLLGDAQESFKSGVKKLEDQDHPAAQLIDSVCGPYFDGTGGGGSGKGRRAMRHSRSSSFYSEDVDSEDDRTLSDVDDEQTLDTDYNQDKSTVASASMIGPVTKPSSTTNKKVDNQSLDSSYMSQSDYESEVGGRPGRRKKRGDRSSIDSDYEDDNTKDGFAGQVQLLSKPLASSFAKRCYFTKSGIGKTTQHYEGLTLTGNVVLMLAAAMKLKGCPTICDEDLRRVEQTYPNQFSRLPDELLLSSGWRRISKYCHFSNKPIPDGIPFFHSKQRLHPQGGYYFLLAAAVGMVRPIDVEPLTRDTLVLLETDYPGQCDAAPDILIQDPEEWVLVDKFCFFSGGPINTEEDVYYQADFDGNPIYMLAFLSPSLTPEELYKLEGNGAEDENGMLMPPGLTSVAAVEEVESVYDLTERDFHDLKLYHLGPCRALPQYILQPHAWRKVLPPHFLEARHQAILRAQEYEMRNGGPVTPMPRDPFAQRAQQLTVGAAPAGGRYDVYAEYDQQQQQQNFPHDHQGGVGPYVPGTSPGEHGNHNDSYYMQQQAAMMVNDQGFGNEYAQPFGPQPGTMGPGSPMYQNQNQQHQQFQQYDPHLEDKYRAYHPDSPYSPQRRMQGDFNYQEDDRSSRHSANYQRQPDEDNAAPEDEALHHHYHQHGLDPPEDSPGGPAIDASMVRSEAMSSNPNNVSNTSDGYNYGNPDGSGTVDDYVYSDSREDQYYDSPEGLKDQPGSQDHEFFNAPSGGDAEDDEMGFDPDALVSSFDPQGHIGRHPDDHGGYYEDEEGEEVSGEYYEHQQKSPSPINADALRRLGPNNEQPMSPHAVTSPMSATSQNSASEYSHSSAMRGAQELLKRNRLRRQQQARQRQAANANAHVAVDPAGSESPTKSQAQYAFAPDTDGDEEEAVAIAEATSPTRSITHDENASQSTWGGSEHNSEALTSVVSGSSVWTENSPNPTDRSSRRALILQMAKARMKSNKERDPADEHSTIKEEKSGMEDSTYEGGSNIQYSMDDEDADEDEMMRLQGSTEQSDLDFAADLD